MCWGWGQWIGEVICRPLTESLWPWLCWLQRLWASWSQRERGSEAGERGRGRKEMMWYCGKQESCFPLLPRCSKKGEKKVKGRWEGPEWVQFPVENTLEEKRVGKTCAEFPRQLDSLEHGSLGTPEKWWALEVFLMEFLVTLFNPHTWYMIVC